ncbi:MULTISPECIES: tetratricopeptide repeat protein [unclassified Ectothiorhodospira]|uniref:tetratricopeptide repeat protein n=1 Tax=unclassified Ectothiorhodospira TaxID=2684909 RepID=UPI001EE98ADE|nr:MULTISPECIES: tetratricopeptide repeat protein [unclassified Ectothiorhodospira]MCG5514627.1 sel1 repeat family protein [Ectothiorhodospira sp. 9100]MCG5517999.1 sel1 repeat family protein [Ectothiorhodospira sp. 9905]
MTTKAAIHRPGSADRMLCAAGLKTLAGLVLTALLYLPVGLWAQESPKPWSEQAGDGMSVAQMEAEAQAHLQETPPNYPQAHLWFEQAANQGSPQAAAYLGWLYEHGHGVEPDPSLAIAWYAQAVETGAHRYTLHLGWMHLNGELIPVDRVASEAWFRRGIKADYAPARVALASVWIADATGGLEPHRTLEAETLLHEAHEQGEPNAVYFLARLYLEGIGDVEADPDQAFHFTHQGAQAGHPTLQAWLSELYLQGRGVEASRVKAAKWASLSAAAGDPVGTQMLQLLQHELDAEVLEAGREQALAWLEN